MLHIINIFIFPLTERTAVNGGVFYYIDHVSSSISLR